MSGQPQVLKPCANERACVFADFDTTRLHAAVWSCGRYVMTVAYVTSAAPERAAWTVTGW